MHVAASIAAIVFERLRFRIEYHDRRSVRPMDGFGQCQNGVGRGLAVVGSKRNVALAIVEQRRAAETLAVSPATVRRLIAEGVLPANQICKGAPWVIRTADIQLAEVVSASERRRKCAPRSPPSGDQPALPLDFQ